MLYEKYKATSNEENIEKSIKAIENWTLNTNIIKNNKNSMNWYFINRDIVLMLLHELLFENFVLIIIEFIWCP